MSETAAAERACGTNQPDDSAAASLAAGDWLSLAATPIFGLMALLTAAHGTGPADILCSAAHQAWLFGGMAPMYGLMSAFHLAPWMELLSRHRTLRPANIRQNERR